MAGRNAEGWGGMASGSRGQEKSQSGVLGWTQAASPGEVSLNPQACRGG